MLLLSESLFVKLLSVFFICFTSYIIARKSRGFVNKKGLNVKSLLFSFNEPELAAVGNVSSAFSVNFFFGLVLFSAYGWGFISIVCILVAITAAWFTWRFLLSKISNDYYGFPQENTSLLYANIVGFLTHNFQSNGTKKTYNVLLFVYLIILFYLCVCEFSILRIYLATFYGATLSKTLIVVISVLTLVYSSLGGLLGVLKTDKFQFTIIVIFLGLLWLNIFNQNYLPDSKTLFWVDSDGIRNYKNNFFLDFINYIGAFFFVYFAFLLYPDFWMRNISTLKRYEKAWWSINWSFPFIILLVITPACIGLAEGAIANAAGSKTLNYDFSKIASALLNLNKDGLSFFFLISALVCASVTTLDTLIVLILQNLTLKHYLNKKTPFKIGRFRLENQPRKSARFTKILLAGLGCICLLCFFSFFIGATGNNFDDGSLAKYMSWEIFGVIFGSLIIYPGYILLINVILGSNRVDKTHFFYRECDLYTSIALALSLPLGIILSLLNNSHSNYLIKNVGEIWHPVIPLTIFPITLFLVYIGTLFICKVVLKRT